MYQKNIFLCLLLIAYVLIATRAFPQKLTPDYQAIKLKLENILEADQKWRLKDIEMSAEPDFDPKSAEALALKDSFLLTDSLNHAYVDSILKNFGWLDTSKIGSKANAAIFLVVQHAKPKYIVSMWSVIRKAYKSSALLPKDYALMYDRVQVYKGKKQLYGTQTKHYDGKLFIAPVKRKRTLDKRRERMGLRVTEVEYIQILEKMYHKKVYGIK